MKRSNYMGLWCIVLLYTAASMLTGCSDGDFTDEHSDMEYYGKTLMVTLNLSIDVTGKQQAAQRTSSAPNEIITPGTKEESTVNSITVFIVDLDNAGNETSTSSHTTFDVVPWEGGGSHTEELSLKTTYGKKHIYIGANLTVEQIKSFATKTNAAYTVKTGSDYADYDTMMDEFIGKKGFSMFGRATEKGSGEIEIPNEPRPMLKLDVNLSRMVAKVLVTVSPNPNNETYANVSTDSTENWNDRIWIRMEDVHFMLNVTNRKTFMYQKEELGQVIDPNHKFEDLIELTTDGVFQFKTDDFSREFVRWLPHKWNTSDKWGMPALKHEEQRMPNGNNADICFYEGLYCLENTISTLPEKWQGVLNNNKEAVTFMATTYTLIATRITPKWIITQIGEDPTYKGATETSKPYEAKDEDDAKSYLGANPEDKEKYPEGTFYTTDRKFFYSYKGMMERIKADEYLDEDDPDKVTRENFAAYPGGWGYYFTYVDGDNVDDTKITFGNERSSVIRNHYYILHVKEFGAPPIPGDLGVNTMNILVRRYGWTDAGEGELILKP